MPPKRDRKTGQFLSTKRKSRGRLPCGPSCKCGCNKRKRTASTTRRKTKSQPGTKRKLLQTAAAKKRRREYRAKK